MNKREFKFRAYYKPDFETKDGPLKFVQTQIEDELFFVCEKDPEIKYPFFDPFTDDNWIVQQYTGIEDSQGNEIFEGDVIEYRVHTLRKGFVEYFASSFICNWLNQTDDKLDQLMVESLRVAGNIIENRDNLYK